MVWLRRDRGDSRELIHLADPLTLGFNFHTGRQPSKVQMMKLMIDKDFRQAMLKVSTSTDHDGFLPTNHPPLLSNRGEIIVKMVY
ncbi:hypothetical protein MCOR14_009148 [Pyricularia oryzae]|nr:hypothetical protein MCOR14_009148 [Pyricularia oryzae]